MPVDIEKEKAIIDKYVGALREEILLYYDQQGLRASGNLAEELVVDYDPQTGRILLTAPDYVDYLVDGRQPGPVPIQVIRDWISNKGIQGGDITQEQLAWAIATKIKNEGIRVPNENNTGELLDPIEDFVSSNKINDLAEELAQLYADDFDSRIQELLDKSKAFTN